MSLCVLHHLHFSRTIFTKSLAFFVTFILLTVSILSSHGSALPNSNDSSGLFFDRIQNFGGDIQVCKKENKSSDCEVRVDEDGNSIINILCLVDEKDANDIDFNYTFEFVNCTNPGNDDTDGDGILDNIEIANRDINPSQYNPNIQDSLPPTVKNVKISMDEHWTSITVTIIPSVTILGVTTPAVTVSVNIIDGISIRVTADVFDASGVESITFTKDSTVVDGLLVSGNTFNAGFFLGISLGSLIKLVTDVAVGFTVKVKAFDYLGNWNECNGTYKGPFTVMVEIYVSMLMSAWNAWCAVGEAVKNALESLGSWILDTIISMVTSALAVIEACMESYAKGVAVAAASAWEEYQATGSISAGKLDAIVNAIFTPFVKAILVLVTVLIVVVRLAELATGVGAAITLIIPLIIGMVAISVDNPFTSLSNSGEAVESFFEWMFDLTNFDALDYITLIVATAALALSVASKIFAVGTAFALVLSVIGLILAWASGKNLMPNVDVILGCVGVAIAGVGLFFAFTGALGLGKDALASQGLVAALAILVGLISFIFGIVFLSITISKTTT